MVKEKVLQKCQLMISFVSDDLGTGPGVVLIHCNIISSDCWQETKVFYRFVPNKSFGQLLDISAKDFVFLKHFNSEFYNIEIWFTDHNFKPQEIKDEVNLTLIVY